MNVIQRLRNLFLQPNAEWQAIDLETHEAKALTKTWLVPVAAVASIAAMLGAMLWGISVGPITVRFGFGDALVQALLSFVASIGIAWLLAWIINTLAPTFGGTKSFDRAFATSAFAMAGSLVGGMMQILPFFAGLLSLLFGVWSLVLLYKGLPVMMKVAPAKALPYTALVVLAAIICNMLIMMVVSRLAPATPGMLGAGLPGTSSVSVQTGAGTLTTTTDKIEAAGRRMEAAVRDAERANQRQDPQGVAKAASDAVAAVTSVAPGGSRAPIAAELLKGWLPEAMGGMPRESYEVQGGTALGVTGSTAKATYRDGPRRLELEVLDAGGAAGILAMIGGLQSGERETSTLVERSFQRDRRRVTEKRWKTESRGELTVILANGVLVSLKGEGVDLDALRAAASDLKLEHLEAASAPARG